MRVIWRDVNLKTHEINLDGAVDVRIDGLSMSLDSIKGVRIHCDHQISVEPIAANAVLIKGIE